VLGADLKRGWNLIFNTADDGNVLRSKGNFFYKATIYLNLVAVFSHNQTTQNS
jgi:hypothetical protein